MLLLADPLVASVPVIDDRSSLVDLRESAELRVDGRRADPDGAWCRLRAPVAELLLEAQTTLPDDVRLLIVEGYRPAGLQDRYFSEHLVDVARDEPDWPAAHVVAETSKHVSPLAVAPHPAGAAVDLTLIADGVELDLGTHVNATPRESNGACFTDAAEISREARHWREVLGAAMASVGLVNYPPEWWHWSFGDRYWAAVTGAPHALYGPVYNGLTP